MVVLCTVKDTPKQTRIDKRKTAQTPILQTFPRHGAHTAQAYQMPCQSQDSTLVFLRDIERDVPEPGELLYSRHDANLNPCHGDKNPNHALRTISVDNSVRAIMGGNPIRQRTITTRHPNCNPNEQYAAQPIDNPDKQRALHTTISYSS